MIDSLFSLDVTENVVSEAEPVKKGVATPVKGATTTPSVPKGADVKGESDLMGTVTESGCSPSCPGGSDGDADDFAATKEAALLIETVWICEKSAPGTYEECTLTDATCVFSGSWPMKIDVDMTVPKKDGNETWPRAKHSQKICRM